eukprot:jgi/Chrzof1/13492/UNPLg00580.t1
MMIVDDREEDVWTPTQQQYVMQLEPWRGESGADQLQPVMSNLAQQAMELMPDAFATAHADVKPCKTTPPKASCEQSPDDCMAQDIMSPAELVIGNAAGRAWKARVELIEAQKHDLQRQVETAAAAVVETTTQLQAVKGDLQHAISLAEVNGVEVGILHSELQASKAAADDIRTQWQATESRCAALTAKIEVEVSEKAELTLQLSEATVKADETAMLAQYLIEDIHNEGAGPSTSLKPPSSSAAPHHHRHCHVRQRLQQQ